MGWGKPSDMGSPWQLSCCCAHRSCSCRREDEGPVQALLHVGPVQSTASSNKPLPRLPGLVRTSLHQHLHSTSDDKESHHHHTLLTASTTIDCTCQLEDTATAVGLPPCKSHSAQLACSSSCCVLLSSARGSQCAAPAHNKLAQKETNNRPAARAASQLLSVAHRKGIHRRQGLASGPGSRLSS